MDMDAKEAEVAYFGGEHPRLREVPVPIGSCCLACQTPLVEGDHGFSLAQAGLAAEGERAYYHHDCFMRCLGVEQYE